jgi:hypothetical protein
MDSMMDYQEKLQRVSEDEESSTDTLLGNSNERTKKDERLITKWMIIASVTNVVMFFMSFLLWLSMARAFQGRNAAFRAASRYCQWTSSLE